MRIFVTAVAGTAMGSLAGLLKELGHDVAGSDTAYYPPMGPSLKEWGVRCFSGFDAKHLEGDAFDGERPDVVVIGNVCRRDNPEAVAAERLGIERIHVADALRRFVLSGTSPLVVAGTHGKTTTSGLCAHLLDQAGQNPGFFIGGIVQSFGRGFRQAGKRALFSSSSNVGARGVPFVLEGDEYDTAFWEKTAKFLHYGAEVAIITSIEHDHIDIYPTLESYEAAFERFVMQLPPTGLLIAYAGDSAVRRLAERAPCEVSYYAVQGDDTGPVSPHFLAAPAIEAPEGTSFDLFVGGMLAGRFVSALHGLHNLRNVTAAIAAATQGYGATFQDLVGPLARFGGVKRRQELIGTPRGISVYDDFAHHPTAVAETLRGLRRKHPTGKMIAIFEPRSATACRRLHQEAYETAFGDATHVLLPQVGRPDLPASEQLDVPGLVRAIASSTAGKRRIFAYYEPEVSGIVERVVGLAEPGDTVAVLSNGAFGGIHGRLLQALGAGDTMSHGAGPAEAISTEKNQT